MDEQHGKHGQTGKTLLSAGRGAGERPAPVRTPGSPAAAPYALEWTLAKYLRLLSLCRAAGVSEDGAQVVFLFARGLSDTAIGTARGLSLSSVRDHLQRAGDAVAAYLGLDPGLSLKEARELLECQANRPLTEPPGEGEAPPARRSSTPGAWGEAEPPESRFFFGFDRMPGAKAYGTRPEDAQRKRLGGKPALVTGAARL